MTQIARYTGNLKAYGSTAVGTERTVFGALTQSDVLDDNINVDYLRGWGIVPINGNPTKQDFNAVAFTAGQILAYLHQEGMPAYDSLQEYFIGSITKKAGIQYTSQVEPNIGNDPLTDDGTNWKSSAIPFTHSFLSKGVAGKGTIALTPAESSNGHFKFTGVLTGNRTVTIQADEHKFSVDNQTTGAFALEVKTVAGVGITVDQTKASALYCDGTDVIDPNNSKSVAVSHISTIIDVTASVAANALTVGMPDTRINFRSSTLSTGTVTRLNSGALSLAISAGSTLGTVAGVAARIAILAINNAGVVELAVVNLAGGNNLDETTLITTVAEGGAGAADSANVIYSATASTNVPFRVVGYVELTQAVPGTWATAPSTVQGAGGNALSAMGSIGFGQTWQDVSASRAIATTYRNTTGKPIVVSASIRGDSVPGRIATLNVDGSPIAQGYTTDYYSAWAAVNIIISLSAIVPHDSTFSVTLNGGTAPIIQWKELRG